MTVSLTPGGAIQGISFAASTEGTAYNQLNLSSLHLPLTDTVVPARGSSTPTFTRATAAWSFDNEGKLNLNVPSGCARFKGGRLVRNLVPTTSEAITGFSTVGATTPSATVMLAVAGNTQHYISRTCTGQTSTVGFVYVCRCRISKNTHNIVQLSFTSATHGTSTYINVNLDTGAYNVYGGVSAQVAYVSPGVWDIQLYGIATIAGATPGFNIAIPATLTSGRAATWNAAGTESINILNFAYYNVSGEAAYLNQPYVSVGVLSSPYHGAGVDGCKWFPTNKDGSAISSSTLEGYFAEPSRTNNCLWNRDLTNVAWTNTNITAAKTTTGLDNVPNSATRLTAAATDATITQLLTAATGTRTLSAYIKRVSGSGTISLTRDGGTNWTDIPSSLVTGSWVLVQMTSDVGANPTVGIKMGTSGDVIDVDCVQDEDGAWATSPILTTTAAVTRNADVLSYASAFDVTQGSALCTLQSDVPAGNGMYALGSETGGRLLYWSTSTARNSGSSYDAVIVATSNIADDVNMGLVKRGNRWGSDQRCYALGGVGTSVAFDGSMGTSGTLFVGSNQSGSAQISGPIREVHIWPTPLTDAQMQQVTS